MSSSIAILVGIRLNRPTDPWPWLLFAAGQGLFWAGDILTYNYPAIFGMEVPFPSWGDPVYLAVYPCLVAGLLLVVRRRTPGRDTGNLIDSLIIAIGAGTISWVLLLSPIAASSDSDLEQKLVGLAYPILDLVLVGVVVRMLVGAGKRPLSLYLLAAAAAAVLITDGAYSYVSYYKHGSYGRIVGCGAPIAGRSRACGKHVVQCRDLELRIPDHGVVDLVSLGFFNIRRPFAVIADRIHAQPEDLAIALLKFGLYTGHVAQLSCADRSEVLRVENRIAQPSPIHW